jgi:cytoskeletal protein CcmA (bactofilin family)
MGLFNRPARMPHELLDSAIGPTANLSGILRSDGGLRIEGQFEGQIEVAGNVVVAEGARVMADITARNITVGGLVQGNITGAGRLEILATGQVIGDITVASVMIDDGGLFQGVSRMRGYEQRALPAGPDPDANGTSPSTVYVEDPRPERVATVDLTARRAADPPPKDNGAAAPAGNAKPAANPASPANPASATRPAAAPAKAAPATPNHTTAPAAGAAPLDDEIDFDDIEPVIPDIVIEEPSGPKPPDNRRRGRR